MREASAPFIS